MIGRVAQGALGAYQIFQGVNRFKDDQIGGALNVASGGVNVASAAGYTSAAPYAGPLMAASGLYDGVRAWERGGEGIRGAGAQLGAGIGTILAPGIGTVIGGVAGNALGYGLDKLGLFHKTTRQVAQEHTEDLLKAGQDDAAYQSDVQGMREQFNAAPPDPSKPFAGKYSSWDEYKKAGLEAGDLTGVYGNLKAFGPEWANLTFDQRKAVTQGIIDADLYQSKMGEVEITDEAKAKEIKDNVLKGFSVGAQAAAPKTQEEAAAMGATGGVPVIGPNKLVVPDSAKPLLRTTTRSPGIGLDGRPIVYGRK
jgi:hypothetical protein